MVLRVLILILLGGTLAYGQKVRPEETEALRERYPEESMVLAQLTRDIDIRLVGDSILMKSTYYEQRAYLNDQGNSYAKDQIFLNSFYDMTGLEAYSLIPDGRKYRKFEVSEFKESSDMESYVFYDDSKNMSFYYPGIVGGSQSVVTYTLHSQEPRFGESFFFQSFVPMVYARFSVTMDPEIEIVFKKYNTEDFDITFEKEILADGRTRFSYEINHAPQWKSEPQSPKLNYVAPHVIMRIRNFTDSGGQKHNVLDNAADLYSWYQEFVGDIADEHSDEIQQIVDQLITPEDSDEEKVRKIYYWVQDNIKYIAFEDGMRGFVPHSGAYVCEKRYGDCKDMASIIINMLHHAGIDAWFTWVGSRDLPYKYSELPTPRVDNHMIAAYEADGQVHFLDATAQYLTFPMPSSFIQGKETLVGKGDSYEIVEVPVLDPEQSVMNDTLRISIDGKTIRGSGDVIFTGYARTANAHRMIKSDNASLEKYLLHLLTKGSNKFRLNDFNVTNLDDRDQPIRVTYDFELEDYHRIIGDDIYVNMNLDKSFQNATLDATRTLPVENDYKYTNKTVGVLNVPESFEPSYIPQDVSFENDVFAFSISYNHSGDQIVVDRTFQVKYLLLEPVQFDQYNEAIKRISTAYRDAIILSKKENQEQ